jgi:hypothetical protein
MKEPAMATSKPDTPEKWQIENDLRTLLEAETIRGDKKRFAAAKKLAAEKAEEMEGVFNTEPDDKD